MSGTAKVTQEPTLQVGFSELLDLLGAWAGSPVGLPDGVIRVAVRVAELHPERVVEMYTALGQRYPDLQMHLGRAGALPPDLQ